MYYIIKVKTTYPYNKKNKSFQSLDQAIQYAETQIEKGYSIVLNENNYMRWLSLSGESICKMWR